MKQVVVPVVVKVVLYLRDKLWVDVTSLIELLESSYEPEEVGVVFKVIVVDLDGVDVSDEAAHGVGKYCNSKDHHHGT